VNSPSTQTPFNSSSTSSITFGFFALVTETELLLEEEEDDDEEEDEEEEDEDESLLDDLSRFALLGIEITWV
jgi:hypothetical protein